jgi:hypothetical protein
MIRYALKCEINHQFESWFQSGDAFDKLRDARLLICPDCGTAVVDRAMMAPPVQGTGKSEPVVVQSQEDVPLHALTAPASPAEAAMKELKRKIQQNSEYVGKDFATEARKIHDGDAPERSIYGEASKDDARKLVEDGVPVAPLPFFPSRKTN